MSQKLNFEMGFEKDLIQKDKPAQRILEMVLTAPKAKKKGSRPALNLALVIDKSGSMHGEKLAYVKQAAVHVVELLEETDRVAVVAYDTHVDVVSESVKVSPENRQKLLLKISEIQCGSSTNLSGGWLKGGELVAEAGLSKGINRVLLLTDGLANHGIVDMEELGFHAGQLLERGISTSAFGVGHGFNEHLLEYMSNQGGGRFYFIDKPARLTEIFSQEFESLASITAKAIEVTLTIPKGVSAEVMGSWRAEEKGKALKLWLGDLGSGLSREVYIKLLTPPQSGKDKLVFAAELSAKNADDKAYQLTAEAALTYAGEADVKAEPVRKAVMERFSTVEMADMATKALILERKGERKKASRLIQQSLHSAAPYNPGKLKQE